MFFCYERWPALSVRRADAALFCPSFCETSDTVNTRDFSVAEDLRQETGTCRARDSLDHISGNTCQGRKKALSDDGGRVQAVPEHHDRFGRRCAGDKAKTQMSSVFSKPIRNKGNDKRHTGLNDQRSRNINRITG